MRELTRDVTKWEKVGAVSLLLFAFAALLSISVAQVSAAIMGVAWIGYHVSQKKRPDMTPLFWPFIAFIVASLISAVLSIDPVESIVDSKDLFHIFIFFATVWILVDHQRRIVTSLQLIGLAGVLISIVGYMQIISRSIDEFDRISGFHDHYMTFAGLLMIAITLVTSVLLFDTKKKNNFLLALVIVIMAGAMILSLTRSAWIGCLVGIAILLALRKPVSLLALPVVAIVIFFAAPASVQDRITSIFDSTNRSNQERLLVWEAGFNMAADSPVFGVGQNSFPKLYPKYRSPDVTEPNISHLHNNFLELLVERGAVGLITWMSIWVTAICIMIRRWIKGGLSSERKVAIAGSISAIAAFLTAGMFEYNFGDSEVQMLYYFVLAVGMASVAREPDKPEGMDSN